MYVGMDLDAWPNSDQRTLSIGMKEFAQSSCFFVIPMTSTLEDTNGLELIRQGTTTVRCCFFFSPVALLNGKHSMDERKKLA
ncbi:unnamed protein product [Meloidogyne enterolobii]|uniref:Uncharacterized protein n=1 Tax=Meloidogyne enterolobii TaxID=390850 RepID=A0ACB1AKE3_MELEN